MVEPLPDFDINDDPVVVLDAVVVRLAVLEPVPVRVITADIEGSGDDEGLFDAIADRVAIEEANALNVLRAVNVGRLVDLVVTDALVERVLVFEAVADVEGRRLMPDRTLTLASIVCPEPGEKDEAISTNNNAARIMVSTWTLGLDLITLLARVNSLIVMRLVDLL